MKFESRKWPRSNPSVRTLLEATVVFLLAALLSFAGSRAFVALHAPILVTQLVTQRTTPPVSLKTKPGPRSSGPTLTPANPAVTPGKSITLTSSTPVTWTLTGVGTLSNQTSTTVTYTAPSSVVPQNQMLGCPVLPNDTVFNTPINNLPVDANSAAMIASQTSAPLSFQPSWGISYADNNTPTRTLLTYYGSNTYPNFAFPLQGPNLRREAGDYEGIFSFGANVPDHHVMTVRRTDCTFYESYDDYTDGYIRACADGTPNCNVQSAVAYSSSTYNFGSVWGTDAGGFLLAPITWHLDEIKSGAIHHAVRFTEGTGGIQFGAIRWPASSTAGGCNPCTNSFPMGTRLRLKASFNMGTFSPAAQVLLTGLQNYGMVLTDTGSNNAIQVADDVSEDPAVASALAEILNAHVNITNFEVVDESSLQFAANSYAVCPFNATCMGAKNTYVQPLNQAMITATPTSGSATSVPIAIQGIGIGLGVPAMLPVEAGSYSLQIPFWVNGATNQTVNWTVQSGVGSITTGGVYTPPATTGGAGTTANAVLKGTSAADPNVAAYVYVTVMPAGAAPSGSIRIDTGSSTNTTDGNGNIWLAETGLDGAVETASDYPNWTSTDPLRQVYQTQQVTYYNDFHYIFGVPNGNYRVHLLFGALGCSNQCGTFLNIYNDIHTFNPQALETQGVIQYHYFDWGLAAAYEYATPVDTYIPAKVTNNLLEVGLYPLAPDSGLSLAPANGPKLDTLNGVEILPDASAPHWTIDIGQQKTIAPGQTLRPFYVTDWYTGVNDPTWTIVQGPPGASMNGSTLSLASGTYFNGQPIVVKASDGTYSATATIYTTGSARTALGVVGIPLPVNHYGYKRAITINHSLVSGAQTNFPVTVSISDPTLETASNGGHVQHAKGYDIILASDSAGSNLLSWEVEKYDPVAGTWIGHVKIPALSSTADTVIYLLYGNPAVTSNQSSPTAVWDSNYKAVYHMATITATSTPDSTSNGNSAVANVNITGTSNALVGPGAMFGGPGSAYHLEFPPAVLNATSGTIAVWVNPTVPTASGQSYSTAAEVDGSNAFRFLEWSSYYAGSLFGWNSGTDYTLNLPNSTLNVPTGSWSQVVYSWNQSTNTQVVYFNGSPVKTATTAFTPYTPSGHFWLGTDPANSAYSFGGLMDEVRFSNTARSAGWIATEYANISSVSTFAAVGSEATN